MPTVFTRLHDDALSVRAVPAERPLAMMVIVGLVAAFWPLGAWYAGRMRDGSDDPLGLLALIVAPWFLWQARHGLRLSLPGTLVAAVALVPVLLMHRLLPPLVEAGLAIVAGCAAFALPRRLPGVTCLLVLSLPVVASLQFFAGYPLRVVTAVMAQGLLSLSGVEVARAGTELLSHGLPVGVEPPCSGVHMLWMGCFTAAMLAATGRLRLRATLLLMGFAVCVLVPVNGLRAALLFPSEAGLVRWPHWAHEAVGLLTYALALGLLLLFARRSIGQQTRQAPTPAALPGSTLSFAAIAVLGLGIATGVLRAVAGPTAIAPAVLPLAPWPQRWHQQVLEPLPLTEREQRFGAGFPGMLQRFRCGPDELILRQVGRATRLLHPSRDCFQAAGFTIVPRPLWRDAEGVEWTRFTAVRDRQSFDVREGITGSRRGRWTDPGAWFWSALWNPGDGPWLAVTWIAAEEPDGR